MSRDGMHNLFVLILRSAMHLTFNVHVRVCTAVCVLRGKKLFGWEQMMMMALVNSL